MITSESCDSLEELVLVWRNAPEHQRNAALHAIVEASLPQMRRMARAIARRLHAADETDDFVQEGMIALLMALQKFDANRGVPFSHYAWRAVRRAMRRAALYRGSVVRATEQRCAATSSYDNDGARRPDHDVAIAGDAARPISRGAATPALHPSRLASLERIQRNKDEAPRALPVAPDVVADALERREMLRIVIQALHRSDANIRNRDMLVKRLGLFDGKAWTLHRIAQWHGVSRQRVQRVVKRSLGRMRSDRELQQWMFPGDQAMSLEAQRSPGHARKSTPAADGRSRARQRGRRRIR